MAVDLKSITIRGFKSLKNVENFELRPLNVLIGANGSGKSNFLQFFKMLSFMYATEFGFSGFVGQNGGASALLHYGPKTTPIMDVELVVRTERGENDARFKVAHAAGDRFSFLDEAYRFRPAREANASSRRWIECGAGHENPKLYDAGAAGQTARAIHGFLRKLGYFQFHDTSFESPLRRPWDVRESRFLRTEGGNTPVMLLEMRERQPNRYRTFVEACRLALPFVDDLVLDVRNERVTLGWKEKGKPDVTLHAFQASDGMLRFIALMTLLSQAPEDLPEIMVIDEPELGLHPAALSIVVDHLKAVAAQGCQVIVATQSPMLLDLVEPEDVVVVERDREGASSLKRLDPAEYSRWLERYSLSEVWEKNLIGGGPNAAPLSPHASASQSSAPHVRTSTIGSAS